MTIVNTETGEIAKSPESVVEFLENAKWMLDAAVEMTGPVEVALLKAQIAMADTYARELALSKDIQEQSREMVRRAEYALGRAIRKGQEEGTVRTIAENASIRESHRGSINSAVAEAAAKPAARDFASSDELYGNGAGIMALATVGPEQFDAALEDAKAEGNLSRANVVRKVRGQNDGSALTRQQRADLIADLAAQGYSSRQMPKRVGVTEETVRQIARDFDIEIPADRIVGRTRRLDHTHMVESTVTSLDNLVSALSLIDFTEVDPTEAHEWATSLTDSINELRRFAKQIKEIAHV